MLRNVFVSCDNYLTLCSVYTFPLPCFTEAAAALPFFELSRIIAANYMTVDKETKEFCDTVSKLIKQRHADLTAVDKLSAQAGQPKKKKKGKECPVTLVEGDVPRVATAKTNSDTKHPTRALNAPIVVHSPSTSSSIDQLEETSSLMTSTPSTLGTLIGSGASQELNKNVVAPPPLWQNYPNVQRTDRIQEMDVYNFDDIHGMMTEQLDVYRRYTSLFVNAGFDADKIARENIERDANFEAMRTRSPSPQLQDMEALRQRHQDYMHRRVTTSTPCPGSPRGAVWPEVEHPVVANVNRRASIMADMMREKLLALTREEGEELSPVTSTNAADMIRARLLVLTCKEEEESNPETHINFPGPPFHLALCQTIHNDHGV